MKKDFKRLMLDTDKVQEYVEVLGQGRAVDAEEKGQRDLTQLASRIVHLDFDLRTMLLDCAILGRQYWKRHNLPLINSLHYSLDIMHHLLNDLNSIKQSVSDMQIFLQHFDMRRKMTCKT
jgi:hypothetical protein